MKIKVIDENCIGCGQCDAVCDEVFEIDKDTGIAKIITNEISEELIEKVKSAASGCPTDAIIIE